ncbi:unnamed protein product [Allacma fusca]|uniref:Lipase domain-containing protein n=1 Tax=Allacma fusca TaxID=39272 RepID=A0A8J2L7X4_9HEXA|nr:unnamed protein product [Allacma fusca]
MEGFEKQQRFLIEILSDNNILTRGYIDLSETICNAESLAKAYMEKLLSTATYYSTINNCCGAITPNLSLSDLGYKDGLKYLCISLAKDVDSKNETAKTLKELCGQYMSYSVPAYVPTVLLMLCIATYKPMPEEVCFAQIGCLSLDGPWTERTLAFNFVPQSPASINTTFILTSRDHQNGYRFPAMMKDPNVSDFDWGKDLNIILHGFSDNTTTWVRNMASSFITSEDINVLSVDWKTGADMYYPQSVANARVVAAQVVLFLEYLTETKGERLGDIHIIGHSLGAHIAGYIGKRFPGVAKITGLDPAAPLFDGFHREVRLHEKDAKEVIVLHTNVAPVGFGIRDPIGTTDIYVNDGQDQFGCIPMLYLLLSPPTVERIQGMRENIACSHRRAYEIFNEVVISRHPLKAYPCESWGTAESESCVSLCEEKDNCYSINRNPVNTGKHKLFYLPTGNSYPYCVTHVKIEAKTCQNQKPLLNVKLESSFTNTISMYEGKLEGNQKVSTVVKVQCGLLHQSSIKLQISINTDESFSKNPEACFSYIRLAYVDHNDELIRLHLDDIVISGGKCTTIEFANNMFSFYSYRDSVLEYINNMNVVIPFYNSIDINKFFYLT